MRILRTFVNIVNRLSDCMLHAHASLSTTQLYTHVSLEHLRESYDLGHPLSGKNKRNGFVKV